VQIRHSCSGGDLGLRTIKIWEISLIEIVARDVSFPTNTTSLDLEL